MDATTKQFANRCLPLRIANQAGWFILNSHAFRVTWSGSNEKSSLEIESISGSAALPAASHFGHGIFTWNIPYLFRTPPGYNLLVRGPSNWPKDGAYPLEGIVETDWAVATFTMNWKMTHANFSVTFEVNEPICMLVPQRRGELEEFWPEIHKIEGDSELNVNYEQWSQSRAQFNAELNVPWSEAVKRGWQKHYHQGTSPSGLHATEHQRKLNLQGFTEYDK